MKKTDKAWLSIW